MLEFIVRRVLWTIPVILLVSSLTFVLMKSVPGGPFSSTERPLIPAIRANLEARYHLDWPLWKQYLQYMKGFFTWDLGPSYTYRQRTVEDILNQQWPVTIQLGLWAFLIAFCVGVPLGVLSAVKQNSLIDHGSMVVAMLGVSIPAIALGPFLIWIFALKLKWFPVATWGTPAHIVLPAVTLATFYLARFARITRASMLQVVREEYIQTARAKGLRETVVNVKHAFRNALIPVSTIAGPAFADVITGSLVVERIFAVPGLGRYYVMAITNRDYPVIMATTLLFALLIVFMNLLVDLSYGVLDPRIRYN